jgi:hypothetical protein
MSELPKAVRKNGGVDITGRRRVNLVEGTHITMTVADDPTNSETDVTINASDDTIVVRKNGGADVGTRPRINFIEGGKVTLTVADDPGDAEIDVTIAASDNTVVVRKNSGADVGTRPRLNFIEGSNVTLTVADDPAGGEVDITVAAASAPTDTIVVRKNSGADVGTRPRLNFIEGTNTTLTISDDIGSNEVDITISSLASPVTGFASADYIVTDIAGSPGVINGHTGAALGIYATYSAAVNAALGATADPISIWVDPRYADDETGTIIISRGRVSISSGIHNAQDTGTNWFTAMPPAFLRIRIDSTSAEIRTVLLSGLNMRELDIYANGNSIHNVVVNGCGFRPTTGTGTRGIYFRGANTTNYFSFNDCWMIDDSTTGGINFNNTASVGCGQFYFNRLHYKPSSGTANTVMAMWNDASRTEQIVVFDQLDHVNISGTNHVWFKFHDSSMDKGVRVINSGFEEHLTTTIFVIDSGHATRGQRHNLEFSHNMGTLGDDAGQQLTLINNSAADGDYLAASMSFLTGHQNKLSASNTLGTFAVGTTGATTHFVYDVGYTYWRGTTEVNVVGTKG